MDSTNSNTVSYNNTPVGFVFEPNEDEIYSYYIPRRICSRQPVFGIEEIDVYGDKSPDELFGKRDPRNSIYLFTRLKKETETNTQIKRTAGGGVWECRRLKDAVKMINGKEIRIGTTRLFTYQGGIEEWILHEYCVEDDFLNSLINQPTYYHPNPENIVFCHVYKKDERGKCNNEEFNQQKKRKRNSNDNDQQPLLPEPPQAYDYYRSNVDQAHTLVPQGDQGDLMQEDFMMENYDNMSLPENAPSYKRFHKY